MQHPNDSHSIRGPLQRCHRLAAMVRLQRLANALAVARSAAGARPPGGPAGQPRARCAAADRSPGVAGRGTQRIYASTAPLRHRQHRAATHCSRCGTPAELKAIPASTRRPGHRRGAFPGRTRPRPDGRLVYAVSQDRIAGLIAHKADPHFAEQFLAGMAFQQPGVDADKVADHGPCRHHSSVAAASGPLLAKAASGPWPVRMPSAVLQLG